MSSQPDRTAPGGGSPLRRWGPIVAVVAVIAGVAAVGLATGGDDGEGGGGGRGGGGERREVTRLHDRSDTTPA